MNKLRTSGVSLALVFLMGIGALRAQALRPRAVRFGPNIDLSAAQPATLWHHEPAIGANPSDPKNLVAGYFGHLTQNSSIGCFAAYTADAGTTWAPAGTVPLASIYDACFDPSIAADASGTFYYGYLDFHGTPDGVLTTTDIRVARSTDGGRSFTEFSTPVVGQIGFGESDPDKPWITVDSQPKSRFRGTIYVTFTDLVFFSPSTGDFMIKSMVSRDGGKTWSTPVIVSRLVDVFSSQLVLDSLTVIAPDGTAYLVYHDFDTAAIRDSIKFVKSKDGGKTWSQPADVAANIPSPGLYQLDNGDPHFGTGSTFGVSASSYPTAAVAPDGTIYVAWADFAQGHCVPEPSSGIPACYNADVRLSVSKDGGGSWSTPRKVNDDATSADQFLPWIATGPDGLLSLIWQDRRLDPKLIDYDLFYTNTADGRTFLPNVRVSSQSSNVDAAFFEGDYNNLAVTSEGIFPAWNDGRFNSVQIFTARGTLAP